MTRHEVTGQRDLWLSRRHRTWGPMYVTDIDSIGLEHGAELPMLYYHHRQPSYIVDYKTMRTSKPHDASTDALIDLASNYRTGRHPDGLPMFVTLWFAQDDYDGPSDRHPMLFKPVPKNRQAEKMLREFGRGPAMSERGYVRFLYALKGVRAPTAIIKSLSPMPSAEGLLSAYGVAS